MPGGSRRPWVPAVVAYVVVPTFVVGLLASVLSYEISRVDVRVAGTVSLSVLAGNEFDFKLNAWSADLDTALRSDAVRRAANTAVEDSAGVRDLRAERYGEASRVSVSLTANSEQAGAEALLAAGRTALRLVARQEEAELVELEQSSQQSLQARLAAGERLAEGLPDTVVEGLPATLSRSKSVRDARERSVDRALADLAEVQQELADVREVLGSDPLPGVSVDDVYAVSSIGRVLRTGLSAGLAVGLLGGLLLYARQHRDRREPPAVGAAQPTVAPASA